MNARELFHTRQSRVWSRIIEHLSGRISPSTPSFHDQRRDRNQKIMRDCINHISVRARRPCEDFSPWKTRRNEEMKHDDSFYRFLYRSCTFSPIPQANCAGKNKLIMNFPRWETTESKSFKLIDSFHFPFGAVTCWISRWANGST
jgi:hypothetical protein